MKKILFLLLFVVLLVGCASEEVAEEDIMDDDFFSEDLLTGEVTLDIEEEDNFVLKRCQVLGKEGKTYFLENDLVVESDVSCLEITADEVTLDCQGKTIKGSGNGKGIYLNNVKRAMIKNCRITDFEDAIWAKSSSKSYFDRNIITDNEGNGLVLEGSTNNHLSNNVISGNDDNGIYLIYNSNENEFSNNRICDNDRHDLNCQLSRKNFGQGNSFDKIVSCSDNFPSEENRSACDREIKCLDSDGEDVFVQGEVTGYWLGPNSGNPLVTETDVCLDEMMIREYSCNIVGNNILVQEVGCEYGCEDGRCLE
ncbi:MAG: right-handed parallel beta-helix repeat-containing protein [Nanoarchaeota archaeon]|nr:right-handed parallel beta-helix repeat-containing protein [Nanoarchaeota archaeon]MBU1622886.1 right-handed parallel beta-helix repeat-containing protein [Nanoarchaeota archaeon]